MNRIINYSPHHYQRSFHKDNSRFRVIVGGRRVGKTVMCIQECIRHCLTEPNRLVFWVAPTFRDAREIGFEELKKHLDVISPAIADINTTQLKITFVNRSVIYFKGSDNPDSLRGRGLTLVIMDEAAFCKETLWPQIIRPALSDRNGYAVLISTPNGHNWFKDIYEADHWSKFRWVTGMNPLITEQELDEVRAEISEIDFKQEYLAEFITRAGRVYQDFDESNIIEGADLTNSDVYLGMDFGYAAPTAVAFLAVDNTHNTVTQFDELQIAREQMDKIIDQIIIKLKEHGLNEKSIKYCYTDPAGNAGELSSGLSPVDMLRNRGFSVINKGSTILPGLAQVRSFIKNSKGERRFFVTKNCVETIEAFNAYQYAPTNNGNIKEEALKDGINDHMMDAIRYFFVNRFDQAKWVAQTPEQQPYTNSKETTKVMKRCALCRKPFVSNTPKSEPPYVCSACKEKQ